MTWAFEGWTKSQCHMQGNAFSWYTFMTNSKNYPLVPNGWTIDSFARSCCPNIHTHTHSPLFITGDMPISSLRKQLTFGDTTTGFPNKWRLRNERRNSILMVHHYPDLGSASDWLNQISHAARPIRSTTQIWVVTRHQYGISVLISQTSFHGESSDGVTKCWLFS